MSIQTRPRNPQALGKGALALARATGLASAEARRLLEARSAVPAALDDEIARRLADALTAAGVEAIAAPGPASTAAHCASHPAFDSEDSCRDCRGPVCAVCVISNRGPRCVACQRRLVRRSYFRNLRVAGLLAVLLAIGGWWVLRNRRLDARTQWIRSVGGSVVLVSAQPVPPVVVERWTTGLAGLQRWFEREWARYRPASPVPMITLSLDGVVQVDTLLVAPGTRRDLAGRAQESLAFDGAVEAIDARVAAHDRRDATIYVVLRPTIAAGGVVEGVAEAGGRVGMVEGALNDEDLALELTAVAHELLHCLGAKDKYDADGHAVLPGGLAAPDAKPTFPQQAAEVMVGEIPTGPASGKPLTRLDDVQVGPATAREIRW